MTLPRPWWQEMTTYDFRAGEAARWIAVLPVAAIEQHGPHLPVGTDRIIAEGHLARLAEQLPAGLPATILPTVSVGKSNEHLAFPGTLTLTWQTLTHVILDIAASVARAGLRKLVIVNSHGGNSALLEMATREIRVAHGLVCVQTAWARFGHPPGLFSAQEAAFGIHGGDYETSVMLALRPETVHMDLAADFRSTQESMVRDFTHLRIHGGHPFGWQAQDLNPMGTVGEAHLASAEKGRACLDFAVAAFIALLRDVDRFDATALTTASG